MSIASSSLDLGPALGPDVGAQRWWVALSGGLDSTVLLQLLHAFCAGREGAPALAVVHVHHGMQAGADDWQRHCESLCAELQLPLRCERVQVASSGSGWEQAARAARYRVFEDCLGPGELLYMAHHLDDQVETFFLRLLRGAGPRGLAGMPASRPLGKGELRRPLLTHTRQQLLQHAVQQGLGWVEDPSNDDSKLDRNYVRNELMPLMEARWPGCRRTVSRAAELIGNAATELERQAPVLTEVQSMMGDAGVALPARRDQVLGDGFVQGLRNWLAAQGLRMPAQQRLAEFCRQLAQPDGAGSARLEWGGHCLQHYRDAVYLLPEMPLHQPEGAMLAAGQSLSLPGGGALSLQAASGAGLALRPDEPLSLRWRGGGEYCRPVGRVGGAKLKKLLQQAGVPRWWRSRVPLLYLEDELLAVGDLWLCQSSRYREQGERLWRPRWERNTTVVGRFD